VTERIVLKSGAAAACLSTLVFALCALGLARTPWLLLAAAVVIGLAVRSPWPEPGHLSGPRERTLGALFWIVAIPFGALYVVNAAAPEISPDGGYYHLALVRRYLDHGGFYRITTNLFANFTQGCEMLFLVAYAMGRHSAAALTHCAFLLALPAALLGFGRRFRMETAAVIAALLIFVSPVVGIDGSSAYVDVALAFTGFACFYALEISTRAPMLILAGLLAGFSFAIKYTGAMVVVYAAVFVLARTRSSRALAILLGAAALVAVPWLVKNWIIVDNPVSPFFNRLFPNPYIDAGFEDDLGRTMRHLNGHQLGWQTPLELTIRGGVLQGTLGPAFLLAPLGVLAARDALGRRVLAVAILFGLPWLSNIGTRFLIPALPFIAISMGIALARWPRPAAVLVVLNAIACWPWVLSMYCAPYNWRIERFPIAAALRIVPEREFLDSHAPQVRYARLIQDKVPSNGVVYTALPLMLSYTDREVLLNYAAAPNSRIADVLAAAIDAALQPSTRVSFAFAPLAIRRLRMVATADAPMWTIHELDGPSPRTTADPNPWDAGLAADGRLVTSWRSWQPVRRGMYFELEPGRAGETGAMSFRTRPRDPLPAMRLDAQLESGEWRTLTSQYQIETGLPVPDLRGEAAAELRRRGVTHLFIHDGEPLGPDIRQHTGQWQVNLAGEAAPMRLYAILPAKTIDTARDLRNNTR
jgi:hypothetical protein